MAVERCRATTGGTGSKYRRRFALRGIFGRIPCTRPRTTFGVEEDAQACREGSGGVDEPGRISAGDAVKPVVPLSAGYKTTDTAAGKEFTDSTYGITVDHDPHNTGIPPRTSTLGEGSTTSTSSYDSDVKRRDGTYSAGPVPLTAELLDSSTHSLGHCTGTASEQSCSPTVKVKRLPESELLQEYAVERTLGRGASGKVCLCRSIRTGELYALKNVRGVAAGSTYKRNRLNRKLNSTSDALNSPEQPPSPVTGETMSLGLPTHEHVLRVLEVIPHEPTRLEAGAQVVMEAALGGELRPTAFRTTDGSLDETALAAATYGALAGLQHLHSLRVVHGDLKLGNLLLGGHGGRCVKVADLGCAVRFPADLPPADWWVTNRPAGTPAYLAPEQTTEAPYLGPPADVWAMGVCLFQLASGRLPFHGDSIIGLYDAIAKCGGDGGPVQELVGEVSPPLEALLRGMLQKEAAERLGLSEVMDHPWFSKQLPS